MTRGSWAVSPPSTGTVVKDVVAGLVSAHGAAAVARAAVKEAASRGARVRFLQVSPIADGSEGGSLPERTAVRSAGTSADAIDSIDAIDSEDSGGLQESNATFTAALRALREFPRVPVTFEVASGEPGPVLVERTRDAEILVLAADLPEDVAAYCRRHATCDILSVRPASLRRPA